MYARQAYHHLRRAQPLSQKSRFGRSDAAHRTSQAMRSWSVNERCETSTHSHSIVAGGLPEMSYTTRLMPCTSLMMRFEVRASKSCGSGAQCAVMKSCVCT